jgi:phosphohistidine phosphatase
VRLLLLRHGVAEERELGRPDAERRLTPDGRRRMEAAARGMRRLEIAPDQVLTSPLPRCRETADIVCTELGLGDPREDPRLAPGADLGAVVDMMVEHPDASELLLCGHQPDLGLITDDLAGAELEVKKGALIVIEVHRARPRGGMLTALLPPRTLRALGAD